MTLGNDNGTDGQTDGHTECDAICGPLLGRRAAMNDSRHCLKCDAHEKLHRFTPISVSKCI